MSTEKQQKHANITSGTHSSQPKHTVQQKISRRCDKNVPRAADSIYGKCVFYYRPHQGEVIKKTSVNFKKIADYAVNLNRTPADAARIFNKLVTNRDTLIAPDNQDPNWSRWHNFKARHVACGHEPPAYYISYGYYYCSNFQRYLYPRLKSSQGKSWMEDARELLQKYMDNGLITNMKSTLLEFKSARYPKKKIPPMKVDIQQLELQNDTFKQFAFRTHVPAYLDGGIADVPIADLMRVFGQPNVEEWADPETWKQAVDVAWEVVPHKVKNPLDTAQEAADAAVQAGSYVFEQTAESIQKGAGYMVKKANGVWEWVFGK